MKPPVSHVALLVAGLLCMSLFPFAPAALAGQEAGNWEFSVFGARSALDDQDPFELEKAAPVDFDGDGTFSSVGLLSRSFDMKDDTFLGLRLGFVWGPLLETELIYDRNHVGGTFEQTIDDFGSGARVQDASGRASALFTSYQIGAMYHPLGKRPTRWQPYATVSGGWMDVDFEPAASLRSALHGPAERFFGAELERGDHGVMVGYGVGLKYFLRDIIALRAEARGKSYELFDDRRNDYEVSFGISLFAPGTAP